MSRQVHPCGRVHGVLGVVVAYTYMVEFQRRGLPHLHLLIIVRQGECVCVCE